VARQQNRGIGLSGNREARLELALITLTANLGRDLMRRTHQPA
jgi:hypothetical protein